MKELAPCPIWTVHLLVESLAQLGFVILWNICFHFELVTSVRKGAGILIFTIASRLPEFAHLCLIFNFKLLGILRCLRLFLFVILSMGTRAVFFRFVILHLRQKVFGDWCIETSLFKAESLLFGLKIII